jgi:hypothetical protein
MVSQQGRLTPSRLRFLNVTKLKEAWEGVKRYMAAGPVVLRERDGILMRAVNRLDHGGKVS